MKQAFTIMQIGNTELDSFYHNVIAPAIKRCGLEPKRVDKHNEGGLLKSEIVKFIESSDIIVADLTNERPNCYLEVGYTMGLNKFSNLILTAKEDHNPDSQNFKMDGPKIHFDLIGYEILFWEPDKLSKFSDKFEKLITRRLKIITLNSSTSASLPYSEWISEHSEKLINQVLKLWFDNKYELYMTTSSFSIHTPIHKAYYESSNNSRIENFARIYTLDEKKRKQLFEHLQSDEYGDVWKNWEELEAISKEYLAKNIEIWEKIEDEFVKKKPIEFDLSKFNSSYDLGNTVEGIYESANSLATSGKYLDTFVKVHENNEFKVYSGKVYAKSPDESLIDKYIRVTEEFIKNRNLLKQLEELNNNKREISKLTEHFKLQLKDIIDDFEDGHIYLKGTCSLCNEWVKGII